ncbi:unnamed protein product [Prunus armeniaca]|uniref:Uncharacterized protein n=1 Tax=Prunus armeniaca TaxID=36596 RepID=A0A6J5V277_PRUAR|nr:unnamed protein product [Prunus armeniaca]
MEFHSSCDSLLGVGYWVGHDRHELLPRTPHCYLPDKGAVGDVVHYARLLLCLRLAVLGFPRSGSSDVDPRLLY